MLAATTTARAPRIVATILLAGKGAFAIGTWWQAGIQLSCARA